ncbi:MAG: hypothetical protein RL563_2309 [Pseudomonadota bacterium]|jgi:hypothetical protein
MELFIFIKRLSHPRVKKRLKIGLALWAVFFIIVLIAKISYDIGYFKAQSVIDEKNAAISGGRQFLDIETAQKIVSGALKEDLYNPKTRVVQIINNDSKLSTIIIENNYRKNIAWIIDRHLFFNGDLLNDNGYNLTEAMQKQHNIQGNNY